MILPPINENLSGAIIVDGAKPEFDTDATVPGSTFTVYSAATKININLQSRLILLPNLTFKRNSLY